MGPFTGKVVNAETKEPLEGAVVVVWFYTESGSIGGSVGHLADTFEALTDKNGDFKIPLKLVAPMELFHTWGKDINIIIFKPGYGTYPGNNNTYCSGKIKSSYYIEGNNQVYYLPKLSTIKERLKNFKDIRYIGISSSEKIKIFNKLRDEEKSAIRLGS